MSEVKTAGAKVVNPSYWWWLLPTILGVIGGLIAWGVHRGKHKYVANSMLIVGIAATVMALIYTITI